MFLAFSSLDFLVLDEKYVSTIAAALNSEDDELKSLVFEIKAGKLFRGDKFGWFSLPDDDESLDEVACWSDICGDDSMILDFNCCSGGGSVICCSGSSSELVCGSGVNGRLFT